MRRVGLLIVGLSLLLAGCESSSEPKVSMSVEQAMEAGKRIADASQSALASHLIKEIENVGFEGAVTYCHVNALPITDSLSLIYNAEIRRTSFRNRNDANAPDSLDRVVLARFERMHEGDTVPKPEVRYTERGKARYYSPIFVAPICLNCHGMTGMDLTADLHALILDEYPNDEAVGFETGDVRGAWVIEFAESQAE